MGESVEGKLMSVSGSEKKIKVLLVGPVPPPYGGIPAYVKSLLDADLDSVTVSLFNTAIPAWAAPLEREGKRSYASIFEAGIGASIKKIGYVLFSFGALFWSLLKTRPDIVHVFTCSYWGYWRNWIYILIARLAGRKTIFHLLGAIDLFYNEVGSFQRALLRSSLNSADCYLLQSPLLEAWARQYSRKEVIGIWNGIDFSKIAQKQTNPPELMAAMKAPIGLTIGNLSVNKGTQEIIRALAVLKEQGLEFYWVFVGRGDVQQYERLVVKNGLESQVRFAGEVSESGKWHFLQSASFFCLPSFAEGQPISIIEAMACGLPIISTRVGSIPEMISEDVNGKLVEAGDTQGLGAAILALVQNPELRARMGQNSSRMARERYEIADLYRGLSRIYSRLSGIVAEKVAEQ
jgi:glycosyltransferase involved in cell wall biosynthesis